MQFEHDYSEIIKQGKEPTNEDQPHLVKVLCTINQSSTMLKQITNVIKDVKPPIRSLSRSLEIIMKEYRDTKNACIKASLVGYKLVSKDHNTSWHKQDPSSSGYKRGNESTDWGYASHGDKPKLKTPKKILHCTPKFKLGSIIRIP